MCGFHSWEGRSASCTFASHLPFDARASAEVADSGCASYLFMQLIPTTVNTRGRPEILSGYDQNLHPRGISPPAK